MLIKQTLVGAACLFAIHTLNAANEDFQSYLNNQKEGVTQFGQMEQAEFDQYQMELEDGFKSFKEAYQQAYQQYKNDVTHQWGEFRDSDQKSWVSYSENGTIRSSVNYETGKIEVDVIAQENADDSELAKRAFEQIGTLFSATEKDAFESDPVAQKVETVIANKPNVVKKGTPSGERKVLEPLLPQISELTTSHISDLIDKILKPASTAKINKAKKEDHKVMSVTLTIPPKLKNKAQRFEKRVRAVADKEKLSPALVFAVMEAESHFNPLAKSHIPAFGLMQIVPTSAGKDATAYLFGKQKVLSPSYLYNSDNNIEIGGAYLYLLYYKYLKAIKDPQSRLYCAIAAYNTGAGNVARAFTGSTNIRKASKEINRMTPEQVFEHLKKNLPYEETQRYIVKVTSKMERYN